MYYTLAYSYTDTIVIKLKQMPFSIRFDCTLCFNRFLMAQATMNAQQSFKTLERKFALEHIALCMQILFLNPRRIQYCRHIEIV